MSELISQNIEIDADIVTPNANEMPQNLIEKKELYGPLKINVYGLPRSQKVPLPNAIKMAKPGVIPNERFLKIEAETKRPIKTVSTVPFQKKGGKSFSFTFSFVCIGNV